MFSAAARHRGGYILRPDLLDIGLRDRDIRDGLRSGLLVRLRVGTQRATQVWQLPPQYRVEAGPAFFGDLKVLLGPACLEG